MKSKEFVATLREVAQAAGVSVATASRACSRPELVSPRTREAVAAAIEKLGYRPNVIARDLRRATTGIVLVVVPSLSPYFLDIFRGVEEAGSALGFTALVGHTDRQGEREVAFVDQVRSRRADGVILATSVDSGGIHTARANTPPVVVALDECGLGFLPSVSVDHEAAAFGATSHLLGLGHRRLAHIAGAAGSSMADHRRRGFRRALAAAGVPFGPALCYPGDFTVEAGERAMEHFLMIPRRPTAVFAANDEMALGALRACRRAGLRTPRDMSIIGFDDQRIAALTDPPLTTVSVPTLDLGRQAMVQLGRILAGEAVEQKLVLPTKLIFRGSTAPPRPA